MIEDIGGHLGLFATAPNFMSPIGRHLGEPLAATV